VSSNSASQVARAAASTQTSDLPPILTFNRQRHRCRNGYRWFTEPQSSSIVGRTPDRVILASFTPGPIFPSSFSGDTHVDYLNLLLDDSITKEIVEKTNACTRILRELAKQRFKATFKDTCEEEILALIGLLLLSDANKDNHVATEEMFKLSLGIPAYRTAFTERRFCFLLRCIRFDDPETMNERKKENTFAAVSKIWDVITDNYKQRYYLGEYITIDEQLLVLRGRCGLRMYIPHKPAKYGLKITMAVCDSRSSYMLHAMPYLGKKTKPPDAVALSHYVTMELCKPCFVSKRNISGDNWFTSVPLVNDLLEKGLTYEFGKIKGKFMKRYRQNQIPTQAVCISF